MDENGQQITDEEITAGNEEESSDEEGLDMEDVGDIKNESDVPKPTFPFLMMIFAVLKDGIDILDIGLLSTISSAFFYPIFYLWLQDKPPFFRKNLKKFMERRAFLPLIEFIPVLGILPLTTVFVYLVYKQEVLLSGKLSKIVSKRLKL